MAAPDDRLIDFEIRLAYQDRTLAALDLVVRTLHDKVDRLEKELGELRRGTHADAPIGPANDPPPHY